MNVWEIYLYIKDILDECARKHGYCLAVHGSLNRDIDLVAVPWVEECDSSIELVNTIASEIKRMSGKVEVIPCPYPKPHGRKAWAIFFKDTYIDLSVVPRGGKDA